MVQGGSMCEKGLAEAHQEGLTIFRLNSYLMAKMLAVYLHSKSTLDNEMLA